MNKKTIPYVIGVPNISIGLLWGMNLVLIPMLAATVTSSNAQLGTLVSMGAFTGMFVQYIAGILSDRSRSKMGRRKPFILAGILSASVFICMMPFAKSYGILFATAFCFYFSLNFFQGPYYSLIPEAVDEKQLGLANGFSKILSILGSGVILVAGPILWQMDQKLPFILAAVIAVVSVLASIFLIKEKPGEGKRAEKLSFDFIKFPSVMKLYISVFFVFVSYGCITPFFVKYCTSVLNFSQSTASNGLLLLTLAGAIFAYPIGVLSDKVERRKVLVLGDVYLRIGAVGSDLCSNEPADVFDPRHHRHRVYRHSNHYLSYIVGSCSAGAPRRIHGLHELFHFTRTVYFKQFDGVCVGPLWLHMVFPNSGSIHVCRQLADWFKSI